MDVSIQIHMMTRKQLCMESIIAVEYVFLDDSMSAISDQAMDITSNPNQENDDAKSLAEEIKAEDVVTAGI